MPQSLAMAALPLAFAAAAQALIVISGGIDLSIGSVMAVSNVLAARTMENAGFGQSLGLSVAILCAGALIGAINGLLVVVSRVPDVIVTLEHGIHLGRRRAADSRETGRRRARPSSSRSPPERCSRHGCPIR